MASVVVIGSCVTDLISYAPRLPRPGETIHGTSFSVGFGGKGGNQCVAAARLGAATAMVAKLGSDLFGHNYMKNFDDNNVNRLHVKLLPNVSTGAATITVNEQGENSIVFVAGANKHLSTEDVYEAESLIKEAKVVVCQGEVPESATKEALFIGHKYGVITLMNAAPASVSMDEDIFGLSTIFCVNETEAEILTGVPVKSLQDAEVAGKRIVDKGSTNVIITLGSRGAALITTDSFTHLASPEISSVVDTTGAGDAFVGALAYFLSSVPDLSLEEMIEKSCKIASFSVQFKGTQTSFPTWDQMRGLGYMS